MTDHGTALPARGSRPSLLRAFVAKPEFGPLVLLVRMLVVFTAINRSATDSTSASADGVV